MDHHVDYEMLHQRTLAKILVGNDPRVTKDLNIFPFG